MAVGDVAILRIIGRFQDQNIVNTMHYEIKAQTANDNIVLDELCTDWDSAHQADWLTRHSASYDFIGLKAFVAKGASLPPGLLSVGVSGGVVGDPQEAFICRTITLYSFSVNPRVRGRLMLSGGVESQFNDLDGSVNVSEQGLLTILGTNLLATIGTGGNEFEPVLFNSTLKTTVQFARAKGRATPSIMRSRRIKQFMIG